jgi:hypothetical protein
MGQNIEKLLTKHLKVLSKKDLKQLKEECRWDKDPDEVLSCLLPMKIKNVSKEVPKIAIHYLIAWKLRNYGGHNIRQQRCLVENFEDIYRILMMCIISSVDLL